MMSDNDLYAFVRQKIVSILAREKLGLQVLQLYQPTNQGPQDKGGIFLQKLFDVEYGWQHHKTAKKDQRFVQEIGQYINTTFRVSCLLTQSMNTVQRLQPLDVLRKVKMRLGAPGSIQEMLSQGVNILRITHIQNPFFTDESQRFEAMPYFDVVLCRRDCLEEGEMDQLTSAEAKAYGL